MDLAGSVATGEGCDEIEVLGRFRAVLLLLLWVTADGEAVAVGFIGGDQGWPGFNSV